MNEQVFVVVGRGDFPVDMLRYDECYPVDSEGVHNIIHRSYDVNPNTGHHFQVGREVRLATNKRFGLTAARWESFGWKVQGYS